MASRASEESLDRTIGGMNEAAGKPTGHRATRKRKALVKPDDEYSPAKRSRSNEPAHASRLSRPRVTKSLNRTNRHDLSLPEEEALPPRNAARNVRNLARRPPDPSPLKGQGVIAMRTDGVDLNDSPEKKKKTVTKTNAVVEVPVNSRPRRRVERRVTPEQESGALPPESTSQSSGTAISTGQNAGDAEELDAVTSDTGKENETSSESCQVRRVKSAPAQAPPAQAQAQARAAPAPAQARAAQAPAQAAPAQAAPAQAEQAKPSSGSTASRPEASGQASRQVQAPEMRREEKFRDKKETVAKLIQPIDNIADLHGCRGYWEAILYSAHLILESRSTHEAKSDRGKRLFRRVTFLKRELRRLKRIEHDTSLQEPIEVIKQRLDDFKTSADGAHTNEEEGLDLFQLLIPELVFLLRAAVKARILLDSLGYTAWRELITLMSVIVQAADTAYRWRPRPRALFKGIRTEVFLIQKNLERLGRHIGERIYLDEQARLSYASQQRLDDEVRAHREKFWQNRQVFDRGATGVRAAGHPQGVFDLDQEVFDLDDL